MDFPKAADVTKALGKKKVKAPPDHMTKALHHALGLAHHLTKLRKAGQTKAATQ